MLLVYFLSITAKIVLSAVIINASWLLAPFSTFTWLEGTALHAHCSITGTSRGI
jgi:hypothetical protein